MLDEPPDPEPHAPLGDASFDEHLDGAETTQPDPIDEPITAPPIPPIIDVHDLDWARIVSAMRPASLRARMRAIVEELEARLDSERGVPMLFDDQRETSSDRALKISEVSDRPLWFIGDLHGDLLALDAALALIARESDRARLELPRIVLLGDLFDDGGYGLETVLRVFELVLERSHAVCLVAGNHDEALGYNGARFTATVAPSDFWRQRAVLTPRDLRPLHAHRVNRRQSKTQQRQRGRLGHRCRLLHVPESQAALLHQVQHRLV